MSRPSPPWDPHLFSTATPRPAGMTHRPSTQGAAAPRADVRLGAAAPNNSKDVLAR
jgi:hypothetical protein